jgi:hypothetical protein
LLEIRHCVGGRADHGDAGVGVCGSGRVFDFGDEAEARVGCQELGTVSQISKNKIGGGGI